MGNDQESVGTHRRESGQVSGYADGPASESGWNLQEGGVPGGKVGRVGVPEARRVTSGVGGARVEKARSQAREFGIYFRDAEGIPKVLV